MNTERLNELEDLAARSTPGPWYSRYSDDGLSMCCSFVSVKPPPEGKEGEHEEGDVCEEPEESIICTTLHQHSELRDQYIMNGNGDFIAEARTAVPELIAEIRRLRRVISDMEIAGAQLIMKPLDADIAEAVSGKFDDLLMR